MDAGDAAVERPPASRTVARCDRPGDDKTRDEMMDLLRSELVGNVYLVVQKYSSPVREL